jgi:hypothetical protein
MGLFDNLVKSFNDSGIKEGLSKVGKEIEGAASEFGGDINKFANTLGANNSNSTPSKSIPSEYSHFPAFNGVIKDITTKNIDKYHRCTIDYNESTKEAIDDYRKKVVEAGYAKATDVRYEKGNEYIIIDPSDNYMHLVFHVKH